jgi:O-acetyl-ADP-ribose deacetylase (regulator of RNase III)
MKAPIPENVSPNITFITGDMFTTTQEAFGHGVNCQGVMGSGIAKLIKELFPGVLPAYQTALQTGKLKPGGMFPYQEPYGPIIFNLASQIKTGADARYELVAQSVLESFNFCERNRITGFALPRIGSDIGGLEWGNTVQVISDVAASYPHITLELWSLPNADKK